MKAIKALDKAYLATKEGKRMKKEVEDVI